MSQRSRLPHCPPYRYGDQPQAEFPPSLPPTVDVSTGDGAECVVQSSLSADRSAAPLSLCPPPPCFDCSAAAFCSLPPTLSSDVVTHSSTDGQCAVVSSEDHLTVSSDRGGRVEGSSEMEPEGSDARASRSSVTSSATQPLSVSDRANAASRPSAPSPLSALPAGSGLDSVDGRTAVGSNSCYDYRRVGRSSLPPPPWPFFSRSSSHKRTSWTSLSAAANATQQQLTQPRPRRQPQTQPALQPTAAQPAATRQIRVCRDGSVQAVLTFATQPPAAAGAAEAAARVTVDERSARALRQQGLQARREQRERLSLLAVGDTNM